MPRDLPFRSDQPTEYPANLPLVYTAVGTDIGLVVTFTVHFENLLPDFVSDRISALTRPADLVREFHMDCVKKTALLHFCL